ncbi:MAG TPA: biotin/lipoyl-binding protein [Bryobacteraceae bacterium]|jgi:membrane fusion protein (multidrug efflux system)|nr:biotin/lipoyl-binding protein [Bryobacteraceae bacterium]
MTDDGNTYASKEEVTELREQIRGLRERQEQDKQPDSANGNKEEKAADQGEKETDEEKQEPEKKPHPVRKIALIAIAVLVLGGGALFWLSSRHYESTDDAFVDGHTSGIAARIPGTVTSVYVEENEFVKAGQVLVDLDPRDYESTLEQAQAQLSQAHAQTQAERPNVLLTEVTNRTNIATTAADVTSAEAGVTAAEQEYQAALAKVNESAANSSKAQTDVARFKPLVDKDEVAREQFDQIVATAKSFAATLAANQTSATAAQKQLDQRRAQLMQAQKRAEEVLDNAPPQLAARQATVLTRRAGTETARAELNQAILNLSYCKIVAPVNGIVAKRIAEPGQHLAPGQQVFLITQLDNLWVTAN